MKLILHISVLLICVNMISCKDKFEENANPQYLQKFALTEVKNTVAEKQSTYKEIVETIRPYNTILNNTKVIGDFKFDIGYQPHLLLAIMNNTKTIDLESIADHSVLRDISGYEGFHYLKFSIENTNFNSELLRYKIGSGQEYSDRVMYFSFYCNRDACLIENGTDTIKEGFVHYERTFDITPKLNLTFVFKSKNNLPVDKLNFVYDDVIFNNGKLNFEFDYKTISTLNAKEINKILL